MENLSRDELVLIRTTFQYHDPVYLRSFAQQLYGLIYRRLQVHLGKEDVCGQSHCPQKTVFVVQGILRPLALGELSFQISGALLDLGCKEGLTAAYQIGQRREQPQKEKSYPLKQPQRPLYRGGPAAWRDGGQVPGALRQTDVVDDWRKTK
jgi:hypothetical protein